jgi:hypothetical protein
MYVYESHEDAIKSVLQVCDSEITKAVKVIAEKPTKSQATIAAIARRAAFAEIKYMLTECVYRDKPDEPENNRGGFTLVIPGGLPSGVFGDPVMSPETQQALVAIAEAAVRYVQRQEESVK